MKTAISLFNFQRLEQKAVLFALIVFLIFINIKAGATSYTVSSNTDWTTFLTSNPGFNSATDTVLINNNKRLTINTATAQCAALQMGSKGHGNGTLQFDNTVSGAKLTVSGQLILGNSGASENGSISFNTSGDAGYLKCAGFTSNSTGTLTLSNGTYGT